MSDNPDPSPKRSNRLSPDELARDVLSRLQGAQSPSAGRRPRIDVVTISRIAIAIGVVFIGGGAAFAISWIGQLGGYQTTGSVVDDTPLFGCPGEPDLGVLFGGETVQVAGRSEDGHFLVVRDERGPGNLAYAPVGSITDVASPEQLEVRRCQPRGGEEVAAMVQTSTTVASTTTATVPDTVSTTIAAGSTTSIADADNGDGRPPVRGTRPGPTATTSTTPPPGSPSPPATGAPGSPPPSTTSTTRPRTTSTTGAGSTTSTTTTTTTAPTTTTTAVTTTTQDTTTTTELTTTTVAETTTTG